MRNRLHVIFILNTQIYIITGNIFVCKEATLCVIENLLRVV